jgi:sphingolipid 4-desaturase/C4-monooxygenase
MATSSSATVTKSPSKRKAAVANGVLKVEKPATGEADDDGNFPLSKRDPLEVKYKDFFWTYTEEPHRTRRLAIIKAHPEVIGPNASLAESLSSASPIEMSTDANLPPP